MGVIKTKVICIANQKGGVGKTTTCISLGVSLGRMGKKVLIVDCDPQGSIGKSLGYDIDRGDKTLTKILDNIILTGISADTCTDLFPYSEYIIHHEAENIDLVVSEITLASIEMDLIKLMNGREYVLDQFISKVKEDYDYILIDSTPALGLLTVNSLVASDYVLIPVQAQSLSLDCLQEMLKSIQHIRKWQKSDIKIMGVVFTMVDIRTTYNRDIINNLKSAYGEYLNIFDSLIPRSVRVEETSAVSKSIFLHDPKGKVSVAYKQLAKEVMDFE